MKHFYGVDLVLYTLEQVNRSHFINKKIFINKMHSLCTVSVDKMFYSLDYPFWILPAPAVPTDLLDKTELLFP
jgi:hypothetical protein